MATLGWNEIKTRAIKFVNEWQNDKNENAEAKSFLDEFFHVFGISRRRVGTFETKVKKIDGNNGYIDMLWKGKILIEMKSRGKSLDKAYKQAKDYFDGLKEHELPGYILVCDFEKFKLYDLENNRQWEFSINEFPDKVRIFGFMIGSYEIEYKEQDPVNIKAAEKMGLLHDKLKEIGYKGHQLEVYLVRLLFCLFADDTRLFEPNQFYEYINESNEDGSDLAMKIARLFQILNTPDEKRLRSLNEELLEFPYVNGGLFEEQLEIADFTSEMREILLNCAKLDWSQISPAIFGSMFQSIMNEEERRNLGAHYTSEKNIMKVIKPLFLDELHEEFEKAKNNKKKLEELHNKISELTFLDPACGCGNFLIITYRELRELELKILKKLHGNRFVTIDLFCKVNVNQFFGIEYEEFASQIAIVAMWLIDHQMNMKISNEFGKYFSRIPLKKHANIINTNALRYNWDDLINPRDLNYILGNPPFVGTVYMNDEQRTDMDIVFKDFKKRGQLDYVCAWYKKSAEYVRNYNIKIAFVSTNSITQGEQVSTLWRDLFKIDFKIDFAYRAFIWSNEAKGKASVFCVIIGFSKGTSLKDKVIYDNDEKYIVKNISPYLVEADNIIIESRKKPICKVNEMKKGNQPTDGGNLIIEDAELDEFLEKEPNAKKYIKQFMGSKEYINQQKRWCLWLVNCPPNELRKMPLVMERVAAVKKMRENSKDAGTRRLALTPTIFRESNNPDTFIVIPSSSTQRRKYIPIGFLTGDVIASNAVHIIPNASLYHFGILISEMHMVWMRTVCGRLKDDYRYSKDIVYNNFIWPNIDDKLKDKISKLAKDILDIRESYVGCSLADLYDPEAMPPLLLKAHQKLNRAVDKAYSLKAFKNDGERINLLFKMYENLTTKI